MPETPMIADPAALPYRPCVGLMIVNSEGKVFIGQRIAIREGDSWQMPQGGIDDGEDAVVAGLRELAEETGITADMVELIARTEEELFYDLPDHLIGKVWKGRYRGQRLHWLLLRFSGTDADVRLDAHQPPEFCNFRWVDREELPGLIVAFKRPVYEKVVALFGDLI